MSVRIIALATVVEIRDIPTCFEFMGACSVAPHTGSRAARKVFSYYACTCHEGREPLFSSPSLFRIRRELREIYANQDTPA